MSSEAGRAEFWRGRWQAGQTGWDLGGPHPLLPDLLAAARDAGLANGATVLEPGCGRAHNGAAWARQGYAVTSFDAVDEAIGAARELYGAVPGLTLTVGDALVPRDEWRQAFDAVLDRAMLCALPADKRPAYVRSCFDQLKPGGLFLTLAFTEVVHADGRLGPPFQVPMPELAALMTPGFAILSAHEVKTMAIGDRVRCELVGVYKRRARYLVEA